MKFLEKNVEAMLVKACKKRGFKCIKSEKLTRGFVDRMVFADKIFYIEIKNETSYESTVKQSKWKDIIINSGGEYYYIDGEEEMLNFIKEKIDK